MGAAVCTIVIDTLSFSPCFRFCSRRRQTPASPRSLPNDLLFLVNSEKNYLRERSGASIPPNTFFLSLFLHSNGYRPDANNSHRRLSHLMNCPRISSRDSFLLHLAYSQTNLFHSLWGFDIFLSSLSFFLSKPTGMYRETYCPSNDNHVRK